MSNVFRKIKFQDAVLLPDFALQSGDLNAHSHIFDKGAII